MGYINTVRGPSICAVDIKGLLKVVPEHDAGDKGSDYCVDEFTIDRYVKLLTDRQQLFPDFYTQTIFVKVHQLVSVYVPYDLPAISTSITTLVFSSVLNMDEMIYCFPQARLAPVGYMVPAALPTKMAPGVRQVFVVVVP